MQPDALTIFTDGASRGNPGPAAAGVIIYKGQIKGGEYGKYLGIATNNEAEYQAIILALEKTKSIKAKQINFFLDSELAVRQLNHQYKVKDEKIIPLFIKIWNLLIDFNKVSFSHIPREKNKEADKLVNKILDTEVKQKTLSI